MTATTRHQLRGGCVGLLGMLLCDAPGRAALFSLASADADCLHLLGHLATMDSTADGAGEAEELSGQMSSVFLQRPVDQVSSGWGARRPEGWRATEVDGSAGDRVGMPKTNPLPPPGDVVERGCTPQARVELNWAFPFPILPQLEVPLRGHLPSCGYQLTAPLSLSQVAGEVLCTTLYNDGNMRHLYGRTQGLQPLLALLDGAGESVQWGAAAVVATLALTQLGRSLLATTPVLQRLFERMVRGPTSQQQNACTPEAYQLNSSIYQSGIDCKCPYSNRPLKPLTLLNGSWQGLFSGTEHLEISLLSN
jgi:hypothetical protein